VPPTWRDQFTSGQKLLRKGTPPARIPQLLGISPQRWQDIQEACSITVVALPPESRAGPREEPGPGLTP
jgi:hypothetical protein